MNSVVRNLVMAVGLAAPVGIVAGTTMSAGNLNLPHPRPILLPTGPTTVTPSPTPFTSPTGFTGFTNPGGGTGGTGNGSSAVIVDLATALVNTACTPGELDVFATTDLQNAVAAFRTSIGKPVTHDNRLDAIAQTDTNSWLAVIIPSTTIGGRTITQRVKTAIPSTKAAAEIVVKGCFPTGNTVNQIMALIETNPPNANSVAILNNPNWNNFGVNVLTDTTLGYPIPIYVIIFAQE